VTNPSHLGSQGCYLVSFSPPGTRAVGNAISLYQLMVREGICVCSLTVELLPRQLSEAILSKSCPVLCSLLLFVFGVHHCDVMHVRRVEYCEGVQLPDMHVGRGTWEAGSRKILWGASDIKGT
jgi:hypothetical protein